MVTLGICRTEAEYGCLAQDESPWLRRIQQQLFAVVVVWAHRTTYARKIRLSPSDRVCVALGRCDWYVEREREITMLEHVNCARPNTVLRLLHLSHIAARFS